MAAIKGRNDNIATKIRSRQQSGLADFPLSHWEGYFKANELFKADELSNNTAVGLVYSF